MPRDDVRNDSRSTERDDKGSDHIYNHGPYRSDDADYSRDFAQHAGGGGSGWERADYTGRGPKGFRSDQRIEDEVCEALARHHDIDASDIEVHVENREVTLSGVVEDRITKRLAEDVAAECRGVIDVHNRLRANRGRGGERRESRQHDREVMQAVERDGDKADRSPKSRTGESVTKNEAIGTNQADTPPRSTALKEGTSQATR